MKTRKCSIVLIVMASIVLAACAPTSPTAVVPTNAPTTVPSEIPVQAAEVETSPEESLKNGTYFIDNQPITLVNGVSETELAPGSASKLVTRFFGNQVEIDLNADGLLDSAFLLQQENGGSGIFYYVVAAIKTENGYLGTNAIFIGDRIAPQSTSIDPNNPSQFIVNYADRNANEPMSTIPTIGVSRTFKFENGSLVEVAAPPTQTP
ncbi:MAG TPA: hypothetical protein PKW57_04000 [Anaerolineaceae bacterium]|jgi:hypothetical protein|nr:hypothetical protein [Anaerolineaceae bacterium]HPS32642.1 hypothetical protein [Anaerolineaceae bacterium]